MKPVDYPNNGRGLMVQYHIMREGPNYFMISYKNSSVLRQDPKDAWRVMGSAKFTPNSQELKQWCLDIHDQYSKKKGETLGDHQAGRKDSSFASEAMAEPNDNTKMIV